DWELTMRHGLDFNRIDAWLAAGDARARFFAAISRRTRSWTLEHGRPTLLAADALAMAVAIDPSIVTHIETHRVEVELNGALTRGATVVDWQDRGGRVANARIVLGIDQQRFEGLVAAALGVGADIAPG
ncbi:MAG: nucleoside hydrolase, partial [Dokdonella sp.]